METDFQFTECEAFYKGKPLPFGKPIAEWEKIFGKKYRQVSAGYYQKFIWDDLGIAVEEEGHDGNDIKRTRKMYIFYSNLESSAGQKGKLKFADNRKSARYIFKNYDEKKIPYTEEEKKEVENDQKTNGKEGPDKFIYPYTTYKKSVTIDGSIINPGMSLKEINKNRKTSDLEIFTFRDDNMNLINESGGTKGDYGQYWDDNRKLNCPKQDYYFLNSVQYSDSELEFIQVGYRTKDDASPYL